MLHDCTSFFGKICVYLTSDSEVCLVTPGMHYKLSNMTYASNSQHCLYTT